VKLSTESLARACTRHPWRTIGIWIAHLVLSIEIVGTILSFGGDPEVTSEDARIQDAESVSISRSIRSDSGRGRGSEPRSP
jgi:hypothetical protein